jgi:hypothetical protein
VSRTPLSRGRSQRCLGPELTAYVDRALCPGELHAWDLHLVACAGCRQAVEEERRVLASLRGAVEPAVPGDLRAMLLSMAAAAGAERAGAERAGFADLTAETHLPGATSPHGGDAAAAHRGLAGLAPALEPRPLRIPPPPLPVVDTCAPAQHRSAMRATVFAGLAAGASAAAAWSFAVVGSPSVTTPTPPAPGTAVQRSRPATPSYSTASFSSASLGASLRAHTPLPVTGATVVFGGGGRPVVSAAHRASAESLP